MKSRIYQVKDYKEVSLEQFQRPFEVDEASVEKELTRLRNRFISWEEGDQVFEKDQVICRFISEESKYNKEKVPFAVGAGMLPKEIEQSVIGKKVGDTVSVLFQKKLDGEEKDIRVDVTILSVKNKIEPGLTDEMVQSLNLENIQTVSEYREYLVRQQKKKAAEDLAYEPVEHVMQEVLSASEFILCREDWQKAVSLQLARLRALCAQDGLVFEEMTEAEFEGRIPNVRNYEGVVAMVQNDSWDTLHSALLGMHYAESDGYSVTKDDYDQYLTEYVNSWGVTPEQAGESNSYELFVLSEYGAHYYQMLMKHVTENLFV